MKTRTIRRRTSAPTGGRLRPVGIIRSALKTRRQAPKQGSEGAPDAWLDVYAWAADALHRLAAGDEILVITWFHRPALQSISQCTLKSICV